MSDYRKGKKSHLRLSAIRKKRKYVGLVNWRTAQKEKLVFTLLIILHTYLN